MFKPFKNQTPLPSKALDVAGGSFVVVAGMDVPCDIALMASTAPEEDIRSELASVAAVGEDAYENEILTLKKRF